MGTPGFAVPSLNAIVDAGYDVLAVVTQPDKSAGRGMKAQTCAVKTAALGRGLRCLEPGSLKDPAVIAGLAALRPDFIAVVAYGKILPQAALDIPAMGCVNLHASLLPRYRGASPINRVIMNGETETGVCTMLMDRGMDTGGVLLCEKIVIDETDNSETLTGKLSAIGGPLLVKTLGLLREGNIKPKPQDDTQATYAPPLKKEDGIIHWGKGAQEITNLLRGTYPWPGAHTFWQGKTLKVLGGTASTGSSAREAAPGTVVAAGKDGILPELVISVACGRGIFNITMVQPEGKRRMTAREFVSGYRVKQGDRLG